MFWNFLWRSADSIPLYRSIMFLTQREHWCIFARYTSYREWSQHYDTTELLSQSVSQHRWQQPPHSVSQASSRINKEMKRQISVHKILLVWASLVASEQEYWKSCQISTWNSVIFATAIKQKNLFIPIILNVPKTFAHTLHLTGSLIQMVEWSNKMEFFCLHYILISM